MSSIQNMNDLDRYLEEKTQRKMQKNTVIASLLRDFPWLWAMQDCITGHDSEHIKVNQDLNDLKIVLAQQETQFALWTVTTVPSNIFNMRVTCLNRSSKETWGEAVMRQTELSANLLYLVRTDSDHRITIFRNPTKEELNGVVEQFCQLCGRNAKWHMSYSPE